VEFIAKLDLSSVPAPSIEKVLNCNHHHRYARTVLPGTRLGICE
jgi:hypothetical protein